MIVAEIGELFGLAADVEITTEANPESVTPAYLAKLREAGFTRISIGMQSAVPRVLEVLDRKHRPGRPEQVVAEAHAAGFEHVNLDLIYGAPYETDADWQAVPRRRDRRRPRPHQRLRAGRRGRHGLARQVANGHRRRRPMTTCWPTATCRPTRPCKPAGYEWYEVSNWARGRVARAAGTTSCTGATRTGGAPGPARTATSAGCAGGTSSTRCATRPRSRRRAARPPAREVLDERARHTERIMLGVRLRDGPADRATCRRRGSRQGAADGDLGAARARRPIENGRLVLTQRGRLLADAVVRDLLD